MGRLPCCATDGLTKGAWTAHEDTLLSDYISRHGEGKWRNIARLAGIKRCGKSCRLRWLNYLRPGIKRGNIEPEEEDLIMRLHRLLGNRWSLIAGRLPGRTDNEIKNYWNTILSKKAAISAAGNNTNTSTSIFNKSRNQEPSPKKTTTLINLKVPPTVDKQSSIAVKVIQPNDHSTAAENNTSADSYKASNPALGGAGPDDVHQEEGETTETVTISGEEGNCNYIDCCWDDFPMDFHDVLVGSTAKELDKHGGSGSSWNVAAAVGSDYLRSMLNDWIKDIGHGSCDTNHNNK